MGVKSMHHSSIDWDLDQEYRKRTASYAANMRLAQLVDVNEIASSRRQHMLKFFRQLFVDDDPKLTVVPLRKAYTY